MKRRLPVHAVVGFCVLFAPAAALCQPQSVILGATSSLVDRKGIGDSADHADLPPSLLDVIRASQMRYLEGSSLIKAGESAKARIAFDLAVDLILTSYWDLPSTPVLNNYFQDLVRCIQRDESRYLRPDAIDEQKPEQAVLDELVNLDLIPIQVDPAFKDVVDADILNSKYDIPVVVNESVYKAMNYWLSRGRKYFIDGIKRSGRYQEMIEQIFREESVPRDLMYLAQVESLFKTNALSRAMAMGIWQFTKGTAIRYGLKVNSYIDERSDPEKSTRAAARYLNDLYDMFNDWTLVLAAYNWGEGKVQGLINKSGVTDFWLLAGSKRRMPKETKNHVPLIMASIILARNPENYGLPVELEAPITCDRIAVSKRINLKTAASTLNVSLDELKQLNPALKTYSTPPDYPNFELNVPAGMGVYFNEKLASLPAVDPKTDPVFTGEHKVKSGDTLSSIAAKYRTTVAELQAANNLRSPNSLRVGTLLQVPAPRTNARPAPAPPLAPGSGSRHQVKSGETLASIAQFYGVSIEALQRANRLISTSLQAGTWLQIPPQETAPSSRLSVARKS
jgi:membrane-bound lytic murein transglycosylase D